MLTTVYMALVFNSGTFSNLGTFSLVFVNIELYVEAIPV